MRYRLRTLLILLAVGPPLLCVAFWAAIYIAGFVVGAYRVTTGTFWE